jgi:UDP-N-acetyl-D-glucosamine dehydrogenase
MKIPVIGLGYVGLPLSLRFARSWASGLGLDVDPKKVDLINKGQAISSTFNRRRTGVLRSLRSGD